MVVVERELLDGVAVTEKKPQLAVGCMIAFGEAFLDVMMGVMVDAKEFVDRVGGFFLIGGGGHR